MVDRDHLSSDTEECIGVTNLNVILLEENETSEICRKETGDRFENGCSHHLFHRTVQLFIGPTHSKF